MAKHTEADPVALLLHLLVSFGNAIGRSAHWRAEEDVHYLNLFAALVGETAKGRKGVSGNQSRRLLRDVDLEWVGRCHRSGLSSGEGLIWAVRDPIQKQQPIKQHGRVIDYQLVVEDPGITDKRLLVTEAEFASTLRVLELRRQHLVRAVASSLGRTRPTGSHEEQSGHVHGPAYQPAGAYHAR